MQTIEKIDMARVRLEEMYERMSRKYIGTQTMLAVKIKVPNFFVSLDDVLAKVKDEEKGFFEDWSIDNINDILWDELSLRVGYLIDDVIMADTTNVTSDVQVNGRSGGWLMFAKYETIEAFILEAQDQIDIYNDKKSARESLQTAVSMMDNVELIEKIVKEQVQSVNNEEAGIDAILHATEDARSEWLELQNAKSVAIKNGYILAKVV